MSADGVLVETLLYIGATALLGRYLLEEQRKHAEREPYHPPAERIEAYTAHDRISKRSRPQAHAGQFRTNEGIWQRTSYHIAPELLNRAQNPVTRARWGEKPFHGNKDPHRRSQAMARLANGANPEYWKVALANV
jgi:hypothetical protein